MVKNTLQQVAIPNLSGYLQQMTEANKAITESFGNFGIAAERYQTRQSDAYNNPLIDRLNRAATQQEFNQVSDSIDPTRANPLLRKAQTTGIQKYQNLNNKIQQQQLSNQFDPTDLTQSSVVKNLYDKETDPTKKLQLGALYSKFVNNQQNFTNTKRNLQFASDLTKDENDGIVDTPLDSATTPEQLQLISAAHTTANKNNEARVLANIGTMGTPSILNSGSSVIQNNNTGSVDYNSIYNPNDPATTDKALSVLNAGENGMGTIPDRKGSQFQGNWQLGNDVVADGAKALGVTPEQIRADSNLQKQVATFNNNRNTNIYKKTFGTEPTVKQITVLSQQGGAGGSELYKPENADEPAYIVLSKFSNIEKAKEKVLANGGSLDMTAKQFTDHIENYYVSKDQQYNGKTNTQTKIVGDTRTTSTPKIIQAITQNANQQVQQKFGPRLAALNSVPVTPKTVAEIQKQIIESRNFERQAIAEQVFKIATTPKAQNQLLAQMGITEPKDLSVIGNYLKEYNSSNLIPRADAELPPQVKNTVDIINADVESAKQTIGNRNKIIADSEIYQKTVKAFKGKSLDDIVNVSFKTDTNSEIDPKSKGEAVKYIGENIETLRTKLKEVDPRLSDKTDEELAAALKVSATYDNGGWFGSEKFAPDIDRAVSFIQNNGTADSKAIILEKQKFTNANDKLKKLTDRIESIQIDINNNNNVGLPIDKEVEELNKLQAQIVNLKKTDPVFQKSLNPNERGLPTDPSIPDSKLNQAIETATKEKRVINYKNQEEFKYLDSTQQIKDILKKNNLNELPKNSYSNGTPNLDLFIANNTLLLPKPGNQYNNTRASNTDKKNIFDYLVNQSKNKVIDKIRQKQNKIKQQQDAKTEETNRLKLVDRIVNK